MVIGQGWDRVRASMYGVRGVWGEWGGCVCVRASVILQSMRVFCHLAFMAFLRSARLADGIRWSQGP